MYKILYAYYKKMCIKSITFSNFVTNLNDYQILDCKINMSMFKMRDFLTISVTWSSLSRTGYRTKANRTKTNRSRQRWRGNRCRSKILFYFFALFCSQEIPTTNTYFYQLQIGKLFIIFEILLLFNG